MHVQVHGVGAREKNRLLLFCVLGRLRARDIDLLAALSQVSQMSI